MIKIYHNPRCSKSREALAYLEAKGLPFEIVPYLDRPLTKDQLAKMISKLGIAPLELVRTNESIWKENYKGKQLSDDALLEAMAANPKLMQRPLVENGKKAVVARPAALMDGILN